MHAQRHGRAATRILAFHVAAFAFAAALNFAPFGHAQAQSGHHHGHHGHKAGQSTAPKKKAPARRRSSTLAPGAHGAHHHGGPAVAVARIGANGSGASTAEFHVAHGRMMQAMNLPYTGDPDVDFRRQMIPHHQGAIDMARVALRHAQDPWTRQLAEAVIVEQQREIAEMQAWLANRGVTAPTGGQPRHILGANSYRSLPEEAGTLSEVRGRSWAPGSGVPRQR